MPLTATAALAAAVLWVALAPPAGANTDDSGSRFTPVAPCRVLDTRSTPGGPSPLGPGVSRDVQVAGTGANFAAQGGVDGGCAVPDGVAAVEVTITSVQSTGAGFVRAWPAGLDEPNATVLNYSTGRNISNTAAVPLAAGGTLDLRLRNAGATTQVVVDVLGYYDPGFGLGQRYVPVAPCRIADSRVGDPYADAEQRDLQVVGVGAAFGSQGGNAAGCGISADATAVEVTLTAALPGAAGFVRGWPAGQAQPNATVLNFVGAQGATNTASVPIAPGGGPNLSVRSFGGPTHLVVDVQGYWTTLGASYVPVTPCRAVDTRTSTPLGPVGARPFRIGGVGEGFAQQGGAACGVPEDATAVEVSFTAVGPPTTGFARLWPGDRTEPGAAALNFGGGQSTTNSGTVALSGSGLIDLIARNYGTGTHFLVDVLGYFSPNPAFRPFEVAAGTGFGCAAFSDAESVATDQPVRCWGRNTHGQLGNDTTSSSRTPVPVPGATGAVDLDAGADHACAVVNPPGPAGQIGDGTAFDRPSPVAVVGLGGTATAVAASANTSCALLSTGTVRCWGSGASGQLGDGTTTPLQFSPVTVSGLSGVTQLTAGTEHFCAMVTGGTVRCWGSGGAGQLGQGLAASSPTPVTVSGLSGVSRVAAGFLHSCAQLTSGGVRCWGNNSQGQLGDGTFTASLAPVVVSGLGGASSLAASGSQTCAVTGGTVRGLSGVTAVEVGHESACARVADGSQRCWGERSGGGIGSAPVTATPRPVQQFGF